MKNSELSFVVQGAIDRSVSPLTGKPTTRSCLESLREHHPGCEIILSTWVGQPVEGLPFDKLVLSEDPGALNTFLPGFEPRPDNTNRQIVSSKNGLREATRKYAAKIRNDMIFQGSSWMAHFESYPKRGTEWKMFRERVITCSTWARDPRCPYTAQPFHPPDWVHIGLTEDVRLLWDIELQPQPEYAQWFLNRRVNLPTANEGDIRRYSPEQYVWLSLLKKFGTVHFHERGDNSEENTRITEVSFANNLIILDLPQFPFVVHKYPHPPSPAYRVYRFISHAEWRRLYQTHSARRTVAAQLSKVTDPAFYLKTAYMQLRGPLETFRRVKAAVKTA